MFLIEISLLSLPCLKLIKTVQIYENKMDKKEKEMEKREAGFAFHSL
jgi:hypothetical protein